MSRYKLAVYSILLIILTISLTLGTLYCFLGGFVDSKTAINRAKIYYTIKLIQNTYIDNVSSEKLLEGAIKGMINSLNDPYSIYMSKQMYEEFKINTNGSYSGIGLILEKKNNILTIITPITGSPADIAGVKSEDQILMIDDLDITNMDLDQIINKIRGKNGVPVKLLLQRNNKKLDVLIIRSNIEIMSVSGQILQNNIGYIRIAFFAEKTGYDFAKKYSELVALGAKGIILDLRGNPGGLITESIKVASYFLQNGQTIVTLAPREGSQKPYYANLNTDQPRLPVVVLVNHESASASEIVAASIQDLGTGIIVGTKTYGKGSVQTIEELFDGSAIKITIAKYYTPKGKSIHGVGINPDYKIDAQEYCNDSKDIQLDKALILIKTKL